MLSRVRRPLAWRARWRPCRPRAHELLAIAAYAFDLQVDGLPVLGSLRLRLSLGRADHPPVPEFSLVTDYSALRAAREAGMAPHQLFVSGKIEMQGDAAKAMMLAMTLAQLR